VSVNVVEDRSVAALRAWLEHVAQTAIDWLDALDAADDDREDDEGGEVLR
jgi:hypothetical protein